MTKTPITVAYGDGIGPEIMTAVLNILEAADAPIEPEVIEIGEKVYLSGNTTGIPDEAWESMSRTKVLLKAPITTPQGGGYKSLNVTIRKTMGLYANVRPCRSLAPFVETNFPNMDLVIVRENEEDLYAGIEYRQTQSVYQCLKLITREGCERICEYAFEYARKFNRKKVTCMVKDNIMKMSDGIFYEVFTEVGKKYPDIEQGRYIIDIGTAKIAANPEMFDVIVTENLYGDIISDVAAEVVGSVGMAGSANVGKKVAMFEAIHGSAPDITGKKIANPSGLLNGAIQMLIHIGAFDKASLIENAWLRTLEDGIHTADIYKAESSKQLVNTDEFAQAVIDRLGQLPEKFPVASYKPTTQAMSEEHDGEQRIMQDKQLVGFDAYIDLAVCGPEELAGRLQDLGVDLELQVIACRGVKVWPCGAVKATCADHWQCRFQKSKDFAPVDYAVVLDALNKLNAGGLDVVKTENLYTFDGQRGFSLVQGQ
jgi:isocitrate dehydrogenase